jgi:hypothetical protein
MWKTERNHRHNVKRPGRLSQPVGVIFCRVGIV